jgi:hypothetical protein
MDDRIGLPVWDETAFQLGPGISFATLQLLGRSLALGKQGVDQICPVVDSLLGFQRVQRRITSVNPPR